MSKKKVTGKDVVIAGRFKLIKKLGAGGAGELHLGEDLKQGDKVAVKLESLLIKESQLEPEYKMYKLFTGGPGITNIRYFGKEKQFTAMVMDLLDHALESWFRLCNNIFSIKTTCMIALQTLDCVQYIHNKKYIHRDIKPENFMNGAGPNKNKIYIIDFGICIPYIGKDGKHIPFGKAKSLMGTARYASINTHLGNESSRRDDLETLGYVFIYFGRGNLPWQGISAPTLAERFAKLSEAKQKTSLETLTDGLPAEFLAFMKYVRGLKFEQDPDYGYLRALFSGLMEAYGLENDGDFDWNELMNKTVDDKEEGGEEAK